MLKIFSVLDQKVKQRLFLVIILSFISLFVDAFSVVAFFPIVKTLFDPNFLNKYLFAYDTIVPKFILENPELCGLLLLLSIFIFKNVLTYVLAVTRSKFLLFAQAHLTSLFFTNYINLDYLTFISENTSFYARNINDNINSFFNNNLKSWIEIFNEIVVILLISIFLIYLNWKNFATFFISFSVVGYLIYYFQKKKLSILGKTINTFLTEKQKSIYQSLDSIKEIKISRSQNFFSNNFFLLSKKIARISINTDAIMITPKLVIEVLGLSILFLVLYLELAKGKSITSIMPMMSVYAVSAWRIMPSINKIIGCFYRIQYSQNSIDILSKEITKFKESNLIFINNNKNINKIFNFKKKISIENLSFKYPQGKKYIFENLNLKILKGKFTIIYGASGSGKTTLLNILLGFLKPTKGQVYIDSSASNLFDNLDQWQSKLAYVPQENRLTDESVLANIAFGQSNEHINLKKVYQAIKKSQLSNLVKDMDNGINSSAGQSGVKLSGGQRQRLLIARAIYSNPEIYFLDEATSSLDQETEKKVLDDIKEVTKNKTVIFVTHRKRLKKYADQCYEFVNGKITKVKNY
jgi:ABC-type bacteriocin/lantibiotic exporter with double-glycine peptidase domain